MDWKMLDALENKSNGINAIMVVDIKARRVIMATDLALEYFGNRDNVISLQRTLGLESDIEKILATVVEELEDKQVSTLSDSLVVDKTGEEIECEIAFTFATPEKEQLFMKIHPILNNRPYYLEKFIESRKRPAFTLNLNENLTVNLGSPAFYKCFACNKTSMKLRYKNYFGNLLSVEMRQDYESIIHAAVQEQPFGKLDIPVQTAMGEVLYFYFDTRRLKQVEEDFNNNLFCLLVSKEDTDEDLTNPFDNG